MTLDGDYAIKLDTPLGSKDGTVSIQSEGSTVEADVDAPLVGKKHVVGTADGDTFTAEGTMKVKLVGKVDYTIDGEVDGDSLNMHIQTSKGDIDLEGTRI